MTQCATSLLGFVSPLFFHPILFVYLTGRFMPNVIFHVMKRIGFFLSDVSAWAVALVSEAILQTLVGSWKSPFCTGGVGNVVTEAAFPNEHWVKCTRPMMLHQYKGNRHCPIEVYLLFCQCGIKPITHKGASATLRHLPLCLVRHVIIRVVFTWLCCGSFFCRQLCEMQ